MESDMNFAQQHARSTDPETSRLAAAHAATFATGQAAIVLKALQQIGPAGKTRIAKACGLNDVQVARRLADLAHNHLAHPLDLTEPSAAGKAERMWQAA